MESQLENSEESKGYGLSFFKLPSLYFDSVRRKMKNSFEAFMETIPESGVAFTT